MENLIPSNDTLANDDDAQKGVMCARSTFFKTSDFSHKLLNWVWYGKSYSFQWYSCKWRRRSQRCYVCSEHLLQDQRFIPQTFKLSMMWKSLFLPMLLFQMTMTLTKVLCVLGAPSLGPAIFPHKLLNWVWYGKAYSFQWYSCKWRRRSQRCYVCSGHLIQDQRFSPRNF